MIIACCIVAVHNFIKCWPKPYSDIMTTLHNTVNNTLCLTTVGKLSNFGTIKGYLQTLHGPLMSREWQWKLLAEWYICISVLHYNLQFKGPWLSHLLAYNIWCANLPFYNTQISARHYLAELINSCSIKYRFWYDYKTDLRFCCLSPVSLTDYIWIIESVLYRYWQ